MTAERAVITDTVSGTRVTVQFNPTEYTVSREITYAQLGVVGLSSPIVQFVHGGAETLAMEFFLDTVEASTGVEAGSDVRDLTRRVTSFMDIAPALHAPPPLLFTWASLTFNCVLQKVTQSFVQFKPDGTPVRARLQVVFNEYRNVDMESKEVKSETADYTKAHVVAAGDSLPSIAAREYGNPAAWRPLALSNGLDDARNLEVGTTLLLPRLPYRDRSTGVVHDIGGNR